MYNNDKEAKILNLKLNRSQLLIMLSTIAIITLVFVLSLSSVGFDINNLWTERYWTNFCILLFLAIYGLLSGGKSGEIYCKSNINGAYLFARNKYLGKLQEIDDKRLNIYFDEYTRQYFITKRKRVFENLCIAKNVRQLEVLKLTSAELETLTKEVFKKEWEDGSNTIFITLSQEQYQQVKDIIDGRISITTIESSYYIQDLSNGVLDDDWKAKTAEKRKNSNRVLNYIYKLTTMVITTAVFSGLMVDAFKEGNASQAWVDAVTRITNLCLSIVWGYFTSIELNKIDVEVLNYKTLFLKKYVESYELKTFKPTSVEEQAEKQYIAQANEKTEIKEGEINYERI